MTFGDRFGRDRMRQRFRWELGPVGGCVDELRGDCVHPDPVRAQLDVENAGQVS